MPQETVLKKSRLKSKLRDKRTVIGSWIALYHPSIPEIYAVNGKFDFLAVDMEHSSITLGQAQHLCQAIAGCGIDPVVRVGENDPNLIKRVMDSGAYGVIVPMVNTGLDAVKAVESVYYPPEGKRGVGLARAQGYGSGFAEYRDWLRDNAVVIAQIEHIDAVDNLKEILRVDGIDGTIIGPYDLSASMGFPGELERAEVAEAVSRYKKVCESMGRPSGIHVVQPSPEDVRRRMDDGFSLIGFSLDSIFLGSAIRSGMDALRSKMGREAGALSRKSGGIR